MDQRFEIFCNRSSNPPRAIRTNIHMEVIEMFPGTVYVKGPASSINCPGLEQEFETEVDSTIDLTGSPFFFSDNNVFTAMGCNTRALMTDHTPQLVGCDSHCPGGQKDIDWRKTFSGLVTQVFKPSLQAENNNQSEDGCRLAFLTDGTGQAFPKGKDPLLHFPMELQWIIDSGDWEYNPSTMYCHEWKDKTSSPKYVRCTCDFGYEGNAYLGCTVIGGVIGVLAILFVIWWVYKCLKKRKKIELRKKFFKRNGGLLLQKQLSSSDGSLQSTKIFSSKELAKATDGFNENRILGQGGQGTVFKGMLVDGRIIAVKKSKLVDEKKLQEFVNEVFILSQINHRNVHCYEEEEIAAVANLAKRCLNLDVKKRPTMKEVAMDLEGIRSSRSDHVQENNEDVPNEVTAIWDSDISPPEFNDTKAMSLEVVPFIDYKSW
ncbi:hypothetical protein JCGZ_26949 [Jatropha curcas]|uniref:Uncharacterized protein n=1 Tax=Jatropha curcas TaxID=180498 RepID=A0A067L0E7_JATCU|nr:hypothetical protein JCGZ_26949 [Jatropha curcas]